MIKRFIYWLTNKRHCNACCLFCKFYKQCRIGEESECEEDEEGVD